MWKDEAQGVAAVVAVAAAVAPMVACGCFPTLALWGVKTREAGGGGEGGMVSESTKAFLKRLIDRSRSMMIMMTVFSH